MPLYMEVHKACNLSMEDLKNKAEADNRVLQALRIKYHQFWINEEDGTIFCLMEGPTRKVCEAASRNLYGSDNLSLLPVTECLPSSSQEKTIDQHTTTICAVKIHRAGTEVVVDDGAVDIVDKCFVSSDALDVAHTGVPMAFFADAKVAMKCARVLQERLRDAQLTCVIALMTGYIEHARRQSEAQRMERLLMLREDDVVLASDSLRPTLKKWEAVRFISSSDERFIERLMPIIETEIQCESFNVEELARRIGVSRAQLYRKVQSLTGRSPNIFLRDTRLDRAINLLKQRSKNISEIALEVGYANPSYFARTFAEKFGCTPSTYLSMAVV